ncbi:MAG: glycerol kinase GlpK [Bacteroidales bacterium]
MNAEYILSLDQGTSSSRAVLFDRFQQPLGIEQMEFPQYYPADGWVEHNPEEIWDTQIKVANQLLARLKINPESIAAIGITNQRETTVVWDRETGRPIHNAIVWQDRRTANICETLKSSSFADYVTKSTGLVIDSYFSATKLSWILKNVPGAMNLAQKGRLAFGTIDTWLLWKLSGGKVHATDVSNASRTMLFNISNLSWDDEILKYFGIPKVILPEVKASSGIFGYTESGVLGNKAIPIAGILGDQQAALFGQRCLEPGDLKNTYGTGCFMLMNTGKRIVSTDSGLLSTIAWQVGDDVSYALEGSVFIAGAAVKWLRDGLKIIQTASETEGIAMSITDSHGVYVVPAFTGLGAPYWDMYARGAIVGISQGVTDKHLIRATLESLAYQTRDIVGLMEDSSGIALKSLKADGGASANNFIMQFQADILNVPVECPVSTEATALGAALMAGLAVEFYSLDDIKKGTPGKRVYRPSMSFELRSRLYKGWRKAVKRAQRWVDDDLE